MVSVHEHRWLHTSELLASLRVFGAVWRVVPPTPTISKIESNFNSFRSAISRAARRSRASPAGVSSWYYVFEDDIGIVNRSTVAHEMEQARERDPCLCPGQPDDHPLSQAEARAERHQLPLLYGGLCCELGPRCQCHGGNCYGMCAHAWAAHGADYLEVLLNRTRVTARLRSLWNSSCVGTPHCATREGLHHNAQVSDAVDVDMTCRAARLRRYHGLCGDGTAMHKYSPVSRLPALHSTRPHRPLPAHGRCLTCGSASSRWIWAACRWSGLGTGARSTRGTSGPSTKTGEPSRAQSGGDRVLRLRLTTCTALSGCTAVPEILFPPAESGPVKERKKTETQGRWEDGTPPPHRDFKWQKKKETARGAAEGEALGRSGQRPCALFSGVQLQVGRERYGSIGS